MTGISSPVWRALRRIHPYFSYSMASMAARGAKHARVRPSAAGARAGRAGARGDAGERLRIAGRMKRRITPPPRMIASGARRWTMLWTQARSSDGALHSPMAAVSPTWRREDHLGSDIPGLSAAISRRMRLRPLAAASWPALLMAVPAKPAALGAPQ